VAEVIPSDPLLDQIRAAVRRPRQHLEAPHRTKAAVMLLLHPGPSGAELLFTRRTQDVLTHKGQISFPGGSQDRSDADLLATALRETHEEVGIPAEAIEILGELDDTLTASSHFLVTPFVGLYRGALDALRPEPREVAQVLSVPLAALRDPRILREDSFEVDGRPEPVYFYQHGPDVIWGATARILHGLLERLG
jgi:8-oxo-dGTP pyrophosphatase MutT (NUDIX family)